MAHFYQTIQLNFLPKKFYELTFSKKYVAGEKARTFSKMFLILFRIDQKCDPNLQEFGQIVKSKIIEPLSTVQSKSVYWPTVVDESRIKHTYLIQTRPPLANNEELRRAKNNAAKFIIQSQITDSSYSTTSLFVFGCVANPTRENTTTIESLVLNPAIPFEVKDKGVLAKFTVAPAPSLGGSRDYESYFEDRKLLSCVFNGVVEFKDKPNLGNKKSAFSKKKYPKKYKKRTQNMNSNGFSPFEKTIPVELTFEDAVCYLAETASLLNSITATYALSLSQITDSQLQQSIPQFILRIRYEFYVFYHVIVFWSLFSKIEPKIITILFDEEGAQKTVPLSSLGEEKFFQLLKNFKSFNTLLQQIANNNRRLFFPVENFLRVNRISHSQKLRTFQKNSEKSVR